MHMIPIPAGFLCTSYSARVEKEVGIAKKKFSAEKPVVAMGLWGSGRVSILVGNDVNLIVGRNAESVVSATRRLA